MQIPVHQAPELPRVPLQLLPVMLLPSGTVVHSSNQTSTGHSCLLNPSAICSLVLFLPPPPKGTAKETLKADGGRGQRCGTGLRKGFTLMSPDKEKTIGQVCCVPDLGDRPFPILSWVRE